MSKKWVAWRESQGPATRRLLGTDSRLLQPRQAGRQQSCTLDIPGGSAAFQSFTTGTGKLTNLVIVRRNTAEISLPIERILYPELHGDRSYMAGPQEVYPHVSMNATGTASSPNTQV
jgi:hypothetical protein